MKRSKKVALGIVALIIAILILIAILTIKEPKITTKKIEFESYSVKDRYIVFKLTLEVQNPNWFPIVLNQVEGEIYYYDDYLGDASARKKFDIPASGETCVEISLTIVNIPQVDTILNNPEPKITIKGVAQVSVFFFAREVSFEKTYVIKK